jgi:hypothetical protein
MVRAVGAFGPMVRIGFPTPPTIFIRGENKTLLNCNSDQYDGSKPNAELEIGGPRVALLLFLRGTRRSLRRI